MNWDRVLPLSLLGPLAQAAGDLLRELKAQDVPPPLRPLLGFDRRGFGSEAARRQLLRAVEDDETFRDRVFETFTGRADVAALLAEWTPETAPLRTAEASARDDLPMLAAALYAARPEGWEFGLGCVVTQARLDLDRRAADEDRKAFDLQAARADEGRRRAEEEVARLRDELERAGQELRDERDSRREREQAGEREAAAARDEAERWGREVERLRGEVERAEARREREAERAARLDGEVREARAELAGLRSAMDEGDGADGVVLTPEDVEALVRAGELARRLAEGGGRATLRRAAPVPPAPVPPAAEAPPEPSPEAPPEPPESLSRPAPPEPPAPAAAAAPPGRRTRVPVPPGMVGSSPEGLRAALRAGESGPVLLVDGYNVSMRAWGEAPPDAQRQRLCAQLERLHLRTRAQVTVVFDGADVEGIRPPRRPGVRVLFSEPGEEADEVVVREVQALPPAVPVVVVSSDRWVQQHAEEEGALVVDSDTFLDVLRR